MKTIRLINLGLILAFSIGYMEWGGGQSSFVAQAEYELLFKQPLTWQTFTHPIILAGLIGQLSLLYAAIAPRPNKWVNIGGVVLLLLVMLVLLLAGILSANFRMILSHIPYLVLTTMFFVLLKRKS